MRLVIVVTAVLLVAGCSGSSDDASSTTAPASTTVVVSTTTTASTTTEVATTTAVTSTTGASTTTTGAPKACTSGGGAPAGAATKQVIDVDGDGKPDTGWVSNVDGTVTVGIATAAGGGASTRFDSASPVERSMLVVDADETGPAEIILSDGRAAELYAWSDCAIVPVTNPQGQTYAFDLGDRIGTGSGIGCVDTSSGRKLVGLNHDPAGGNTVAWSRTVIELDGTEAHNGKKTTGTYTSPADDAKIQLLDDITCGDLTMQADGVHLQN